MSLLTEAVRLRIVIGDDDTYREQPLSDAIVQSARHARLAGVTVLRGIAGYGKSAHLHEAYSGVAQDLPIIIEVVDAEGPIAAWLPTLHDMLCGGLVTLEKIYRVQCPASGAAQPLDA